ncbi:hypothetical protein HYALB_00006659 [Hymenoscyphus albidus]|uniref:Uncharacterized protein n=1 Tax=Hymenoscyphus albidus TaxID=595503 RepID=A0A9N9LXD3_9HELO|nr:hypothetical protein HYALB_00006659 [Hymenoscyphus albidus]
MFGGAEWRTLEMVLVLQESIASGRHAKPSYQTPQQVYPSTPQSSTRTPGSSPRRLCPTSSGKPPKRSLSLNLFSIINKFEALDAVSLPYRYPGLQPAPLQVSRNTSRRRDGHGAGMDRLSTIFSPGGKGYEGYIPLGSEECLRPIPRRQEPSVSVEECTPTTGIKRWKGRPRKSMSPQKSNTSTTERGNRRSRSDSDLKDTSRLLSSAKTRLENGGSKRHRSIKEMIKFYDGGSETTSFPLTPRRKADELCPQQLQHDIIPKQKPRSQIRRFPKPQSHFSSHRWLQTTIETRPSEEEPSQSPALSMSHQPGPLIQPRVEDRATHSDSEQKSLFLLISQLPNGLLHGQDLPLEPDAKVHLETPLILVPKEVHSVVVLFRELWSSSSPLKLVPMDQQTRLPHDISETNLLGLQDLGLEVAKAKIGNKIEALYRAKSLERGKKESPEKPPKTPTSRNITKPSPWQSSARTVITHRGGPDISPSKVAEIKKLFEGQQRVEDSTPVSPRVNPKLTKLNKPAISQQESSHKSQKSSSPQLQLQPPPPMRDISNRQTPVLSSTTIPEKIPQSHSSQISALASPKSEKKPEPTSPQRPRNKTLVDRIKLFEDGIRPKETTGRLKKRSFSGKGANPIIASRKTFFELPSWKNVSKPKMHSKAELNATEIEAIVEEFHDGAAGGKLGKRKNIVGKWNAFSHDSNGTGHSKNNKENDETKALLTRTSEELERMVVKEAECGLKEPKPMRLVEMKRMMLLCREKAGFGGDREKLRVGGQFKRV